LKSMTDSYEKKRKHDELFEDKIQENVQNILQAVRKKDALVISRAYTRTGASTITTIIGPTSALVLHNW
jgi:hypothetical protein